MACDGQPVQEVDCPVASKGVVDGVACGNPCGAVFLVSQVRHSITPPLVAAAAVSCKYRMYPTPSRRNDRRAPSTLCTEHTIARGDGLFRIGFGGLRIE